MEPQKRQQEFDFKRATKLWMIEHVRPACRCKVEGKRYCHCAARVKALLKALDGFARDKTECSVTVARLADSMGYQPRNASNCIAIAVELDYVERINDLTPEIGSPKRTGQKATYRINWRKIWNETEEKATSKVLSDPATGLASATDEKCAPSLPEVRTLSARSAHVTDEKCAPAPPPTITTIYKRHLQRTDSESELMKKMVECGISQPGDCLRRATDEGMPLDSIAAVLEHFIAFPGRWPPNVLFARLTKPGMAAIPADQGWYGERSEWIAAQQAAERTARSQPQTDLDAESVLDSMTPEELAELAESISSRRDRDYAVAIVSSGFGLKTPECRRVLIRALMEARSPPEFAGRD